jgi:hypothetical protein
VKPTIGLVAGFLASSSLASFNYSGTLAQPRLDRWMYPFGDSTGSRPAASTFTTLYSGFTQFDDRDAEFIVGFDSSPLVPPGFAPERYRIHGVKLTIRTASTSPQDQFAYDPTTDALATYYYSGTPPLNPPQPADPQFVADADAGRAVELFALGYRNGFSASTFAENTPFGNVAVEGRNAFPIDFGTSAQLILNGRDVSNNVSQRFAAQPLAVAVMRDGNSDAEFAPGALVTNLARVEFAFGQNFNRPLNLGESNYLRQALSSGRLNLAVSSLHPATAFGQGPITYPVFRTKEDGNLNTAPRINLDISLCLGDVGSQGGDPVADGFLDNNDLIVFIGAFFEQNAAIADIGGEGGSLGPDGSYDNNDFVVFIDAFFGGCRAE